MKQALSLKGFCGGSQGLECSFESTEGYTSRAQPDREAISKLALENIIIILTS